MGGQKKYNKEGGFSEYLYESESPQIVINGISSKIIKLKTLGPRTLPQFSNTTDMYFRKDNNGIVVQAKLYVNRRMVMDFDWGHEHTNTRGGEVFNEGVVNVQTYSIKANENPKRHSNKARLMTEEEIKRYGPIILHYNPNVKFTNP